MTLELLHLEYLEQHPEGLRYTAFCDAYRRWRATVAVTMRQVHKAGEKCFVDYSGVLATYADPRTGEVVEVELFVAVLGASNYTFAQATATQRVADFVASHERAFAYFGGVPEIVVPDQLKSSVVIACRYEPAIQRTYGDMAHRDRAGASVQAARQGEGRGGGADRAAMAPRAPASRDAVFARLAQRAHRRTARGPERAGDEERFEYGEWSRGCVGLDDHVDVSDHWYSAPYGLAKDQVWSGSTATMVAVFHGAARVALHVRSDVRHGHHDS